MKKIFLAIILLTGACKKEDTHYLRPEAIVQAYLLPHQQVSVSISREVFWYNFMDSLQPLEGLSPILVQNHIAYPLAYMGKGLYQNPDIILQENDSCHLYFQYNGKEVSAHTIIPNKPTGFTCNTDTLKKSLIRSTPEVLEFKWDNPGKEYHVIHIQPKNIKPWWIQPLNTSWLQTFHSTPTYESIVWLGTEYIGSGRRYMLLYHILPEFAVLFNKNNNNPLDLRNPPNNIINGYGIFTGVNYSDTLILDVVSQ